MSMTTFSVRPIAWVESRRAEVADDDWGAVISRIALDSERFGVDVLRGLDAFSHLEIVYLFDRVEEESFERGARRPRNNPNWPEVGIFAQRNRRRPNRIGVSSCELLRVSGTVLEVRGLDAIDRTPVLDIKPYMIEFAPRSPVRQPRWSRELMSGYWELSAT